MKINQLINETTTAGAIATVESPMNGMASRYPKIKGIEPVNKIMKGKRKKKGPYANSMVSENRIQRSPNDLHEEELSEDDLIIVPGQNKRTRGFIPKQDVRTDREVEMAKGDLFQCIKNSKTIFDMIADISEEDGIEGWVQEKIIKASDYLNTVREYMEQQRFANEMTGGVIGNGMAGESISEGKMAELEMDLEDPELSEKHFKQLYGMSRREARETFSQTNTWDFPEVRDPNKKLHEQGVAEGSMPYPHGKPEAGDKITWYHSNHYPKIEGTVVDWKDGHLIVQSVDPSLRNTEKTVTKYRVPKNNIMSVEKQGVAEGKGKATCGCGSECSHCSGNHSLNEVGKKCSCCGNMIKLSMAENKPTMSRAAKGYEKYGKAGMQALAKAGREGKDLDKIRDKYNRYDEDIAEGKKTNPYAIGMAQAMKSTGDKPPLKKSTITKAHDIAKTIKNKG